MINTAKYFALLENLKFKHALPNKQNTNDTSQATTQPLHDFNDNLSTLAKYVQLDVATQLQQLCNALQLNYNDYATIDIEQTINSYIIRLLHVLHTLTCHINFHSDAKEDLISVAQLKLCIQTTQELSYYALRSQLHADFYKSNAFKYVLHNDVDRCHPCLLLLSVQFFVALLPIRQLHIANAMELVQRDLLAAVISLRLQTALPAEQLAQLNAAISYLWQHESKADFFRHVLLLKATPQLCVELSRELHQQLLGKLSLPLGFASLVAALQASDTTHNAEIVANIVAQRGYSQRLQQRLIYQTFDFCRLQLADVNSLIAGVLSLRRLYELSAANGQIIEQILYSHWQPLTTPEDLINGLIIWEQDDLSACIRLWQQLFCSSSVACLPSALLVAYLPLLLQLHKQLAETQTEERHALATLILRCLDNRQTLQELPALLQRLYSWQLQGNPSWQALHPRVLITHAVATNRCIVKVAPAAHKDEQQQHCRVLCTLLMSGSDHALSCKVFLALLSLMLQQLAASGTSQHTTTDLLDSETELADFLQCRFLLKLELIVALEQLIWHEPLKTQLCHTNSKQFMQLVTDLLEQQISTAQQAATEAEQMLLLILMLLQELLERSEQLQLAASTQRLQQSLQQLARHTQHPLIRQALRPLLELLGGEHATDSTTTATEAFQQARELIEQQQPHLQVYGIQMMLQALRNKDPVFISQAHRIIALAFSTLKHKESYTFLNCVRLFVALVHIMEAQVLDMLSDEYLSETAELDYRLVVGEAILKAAQEIGPLCYRYKSVLLNCFLHGARSSLDEFRASAYANLAQLCRLLTYQVHSFFQELLQLIDAELSTGRYLPAKRGALLVLAELLAGMESLLDYQEMLLPIYRLLRSIESAESCDAQMRQHAANGLKTLNQKCRELLSTDPVNQLQKEIKVLGINEPNPAASASGRRHILELN